MATAVDVARDRGVQASATLLVDGEPAAALLTVAEERDADLLVVGARQDVSLADRLLGTVATEVVRRAKCEVLIVR
jgi:nucleotide-binding universal stress UspA family protein